MTTDQPRPKVGQRIRHTWVHEGGTVQTVEGVVKTLDGRAVRIGDLWRYFAGDAVSWEVLAEPQPPLRLGMVASVRCKGSDEQPWVAMLRRDLTAVPYWIPTDAREAQSLNCDVAEVVGEPLFDGIGDPL